LSGTVTSSIITALSWQDPLAAWVEPGVVAVDEPGVVAASGVADNGVPVGRDKAARVGGRVEVTKLSGVLVAVCGTTLTHEASNKLPARRHVQNLFMQ
jgi:hypothetical protein